MYLYKRTQIVVKTNTFTILTSHETIIIPKLQWNPDFPNLQGKRKLVWKIAKFENSGQKPHSGIKIIPFFCVEGNDFWIQVIGWSPKKYVYIFFANPALSRLSRGYVETKAIWVELGRTIPNWWRNTIPAVSLIGCELCLRGKCTQLIPGEKTTTDTVLRHIRNDVLDSNFDSFSLYRITLPGRSRLTAFRR